MSIWTWAWWRVRHADDDAFLIARLKSRHRWPGPEFARLETILRTYSGPLNEAPAGAGERANLDAGLGPPVQGIEFFGRSVPLGYWSWDYFNQNEFSDPEEYELAHRFGWLSQIERPAGFPFVRSSILGWIAAHPRPVKQSIGPWSPYCSAERIANWGRYLAAHQIDWSKEESESLRESILRQGQHLIANLEYRGPHLTGNHLANNFRGLFWVGALLSNAQLMALARDLMGRELTRLTGKDGCLREGSSHYQLLVTKNFLEVTVVARRNGIAADPSLDSLLERMINASRFFDLQGSLPLIGDVSPDCAPVWLEHVSAFFLLTSRKPQAGRERPPTPCESSRLGAGLYNSRCLG